MRIRSEKKMEVAVVGMPPMAPSAVLDGAGKGSSRATLAAMVWLSVRGSPL